MDYIQHLLAQLLNTLDINNTVLKVFHHSWQELH